MTEFTVGEYTMRNGKTAVVLGEIPNPMWESDVLIGYGSESCGQRNYVMTWTKDGKHLVAKGVNHYFDLMPRKRKIEQWIFSWVNPKHRAGVSVYPNENDALLSRGICIDMGWTCSEIVQAPVLEVEE
jgi:hypothetical protein